MTFLSMAIRRPCLPVVDKPRGPGMGDFSRIRVAIDGVIRRSGRRAHADQSRKRRDHRYRGRQSRTTKAIDTIHADAVSLLHLVVASRFCRTWIALARWPARWGSSGDSGGSARFGVGRSRVRRVRGGGRGSGSRSLWFGFVPAFVRCPHVVTCALVALVCQHDQPGFGQCSHDTQIRAAFRSWTLPGSAPDTHKIVPFGNAMTCRFIPCIRCLPE